MLRCSDGVICKNINFLMEKKYIRRAGIIPFRRDSDNNVYVLLGYSNEEKPVWADLGGRAEDGETTLETALREFGEESRWVLDPLLTNTTKIILTDKNNSGKPDQAIIFIEYPNIGSVININNTFKSTVPKNEYEDEMQFLEWIPYQKFLKLNNKTTKCITNSMKEVIKVLTN